MESGIALRRFFIETLQAALLSACSALVSYSRTWLSCCFHPLRIVVFILLLLCLLYSFAARTITVEVQCLVVEGEMLLLPVNIVYVSF